MNILFEHRLNELQVHKTKELSFPPHLHSEIEVLVVTKGSITIINEGEMRQIHKGQTAIIFPNSIHEYVKQSSGEMVMYIVNTQIVPEFHAIFSNKLPVDFVIDTQKIETQLTEINQYFLGFRQTKAEMLSRAYLHLFFALLLNNLPLHSRPKTQAPSTVVQVIRYVSEHFTEPLDLQSVASEVGCSVYTVSRIFSHKIKIGFRNYLNQMRVDYSRRLLRETDLKIVDIALECGFETLRSFNRAFTRTYNQTPSEYRQR
ncbi:AraC family transcriptional regulator [Jeotgalibaca ciconiae]|uniref:AraC family transcriptional regulator n=1 Tax=Jeotgalibaca ciconiae TaxID=2496265 RepID=A0A3Q9BKM9_9LACT|nr:AraC family transcriptional regulator [Jeotgalibaca ciconiae]AZP04572.1 AraC family transcriptional regulator [Jeotgalibaca ciconiae]HJB24972.1 AraC family transcriptional regulator [Candidatus Jeotgalibaca pullicola]